MPSLSELQAWPTEHFTTIADWCDAEADRWERSFTTTHQLVDNADWEGRAHDAALRRMELDLSKARGGGEELRAAAKILRSTGENEQFAKSAALRVIAAAQAAQYVVAEDLSVTDTIAYATWEQATARRAMAREFAADIRAEAASLMRIDHDIAARLPAISAALHNIRFTETPLYSTGQSAGPEHHGVHLVDWRHGPGRPTDPAITGADGGAGGYQPNPNHPGRDMKGRYSSGNTGSADGAAAAEKALQSAEKKAGTEFVRQQVRVAITDPKTGQPMLNPQTGRPMYRYYDALEPVAGHPGNYIGIEVKSGKASLTPQQRIFDGEVNSGMPANGTLNGQPIEVISARELRAPKFVPAPGAELDGGAGGAAAREGAVGPSLATPRAPVAEPPPVRVPIEPAPVARPPAGTPARMAPFGGGPAPEESMPHFVPPPHSRHGLPVLGVDPELPNPHDDAHE